MIHSHPVKKFASQITNQLKPSLSKNKYFAMFKEKNSRIRDTGRWWGGIHGGWWAAGAARTSARWATPRLPRAGSYPGTRWRAPGSRWPGPCPGTGTVWSRWARPWSTSWWPCSGCSPSPIFLCSRPGRSPRGPDWPCTGLDHPTRTTHRRAAPPLAWLVAVENKKN